MDDDGRTTELLGICKRHKFKFTVITIEDLVCYKIKKMEKFNKILQKQKLPTKYGGIYYLWL